MKQFLLLISLFFGLQLCANAQEFNYSAGLRLGKTSGVNFKRYFSERDAFEVTLGTRDKGFLATGVYHWHQNIENNVTPDIYLYYGIGGHFGYIRKYDERYYYVNPNTGATPRFESGERVFYAFGLDAVFGLEYRIYSIPLIVGVDLKPYLTYYGLRNVEFNFWDVALTIKYIF